MKPKTNIFKRLILESEKNKVDSTVILNLLDKVIAVNPKDVQVMELKVGYMIVKKNASRQYQCSFNSYINA